MKKIIALLLALIMTFSLAAVAFATEGGEGEAPEAAPADKTVIEQAEELLGEYSWILDLPAGTIVPALKIAKIALKFLKVYIKICDVFGLDPIETGKFLFDYIAKVVEENKDKLPGGDANTETPAPEAAPAIA